MLYLSILQIDVRHRVVSSRHCLLGQLTVGKRRNWEVNSWQCPVEREREGSVGVALDLAVGSIQLYWAVCNWQCRVVSGSVGGR